VQSTLKTPAEALKNVIILVVGQTKGTVKVVRNGQSVSITICGVAKGINDCGGQVMVSALMVEGIVSVVTIAAVAVMVVVNWVWKVVPNGSVTVEDKFGGPFVISGHGGRLKIRDVLPPFPSGSVTITFGTGTLGVAIKPPAVSPNIIFTLENGIPPIVISERVRVRVVIVVKKTVITSPFPRVDIPVFPYSTDVM
jgi:hypothetical protein